MVITKGDEVKKQGPVLIVSAVTRERNVAPCGLGGVHDCSSLLRQDNATTQHVWAISRGFLKAAAVTSQLQLKSSLGRPGAKKKKKRNNRLTPNAFEPEHDGVDN